MYARGLGVERNAVEAGAWLGLAEAGGLDEAKEAWATHRRSLTAAQADEAERRARALAVAVRPK
jgi:TPR repeat protein